ncbi:phasin [Mesorhizobium sp. 113-3-3]|uniref:phasin n=1 Tax=Mesorhizobium sp. 113-3-3 TaxID=2744516 RepID=UPI0018EBEA45|nr:phasin [Mesorhizobium sp. 113-3-3]BCG83363.1 phasin [Mesorhizobium sp. 113-3-3]
MSKFPGKTETIDNADSPTFEPSKAAEQVRAVAELGIERSKEAFSKLNSDAETAQTAFESTLETARTTGNDVALKIIAALRANAEAGFAHVEALVAVKSPSEFFELQAAFLHKHIEQSAEQAKALQALMMRAAEDVSRPIKDGFEKALKDLKVAA